MTTLTPQTSLTQLRRLQGREQLYIFLWGAARWLAFAVCVLAIALVTDWWVDKYHDTPWSLRVFLTITQAALYVAALWYWVLRPLRRGTSIDHLAQRAEGEIPEFGHRLVTSIQLTRKGARRIGMSPELIAVVTKEAEDISGRHDLADLADKRRLAWASVLVWLPLVMLLGMAIFFGPRLFFILIQRQLLIDREIPRSIHLANVTPSLWPSGDEVTIRYEVSGRIKDERVGSVRVSPDGLPSDEYPLAFEERISEDKAIFAAKVPPSTVGFDFRAWLGDGRTKSSSRVDFEPRPVVNRIDAWVQLPEFVGKRPDGSPYETHQAQGEVVGLSGATARVRIEVQKPIVEAKLILLARGPDGTSEVEQPPAFMAIGADAKSAEGTFTLRRNLLAYRVEVKDEHGFTNSAPPRRGIALSADEPPHVALLPERFAAPGEAATEETEVEGMPVPLGGAIRIAYLAQSPLGLSRARLVYRINEGAWHYLPLKEVEGDEETGPFDPRRGTFQNTGIKESVEFHAMPSPDPQTQPERTEGGGRFDFQTRALKKTPAGGGSETELEVGDRVEFYVEVFDRNPDPDRAPGRSDARIKGVVTDGQFVEWVVQTLQSESRIRQLEEKQRGVFVRPQNDQ
jgi:hypothetical protein